MFGPVSQKNPLLEAAGAVQDATGIGRNQYDRTNDAQRGLQSSQQMVDYQQNANHQDALRQQGMAKEMGEFTRGLQRDSMEQTLYGELAKGAQQAKASEAANALNAYTQARANTGSFLAQIMGTKF